MITDLFTGVVVILIGILFYSQTLGIRKYSPLGLSPADFPRLVTVILIILGGILMLQSIIDIRKKVERQKSVFIDKKVLWRFLLVFIMFILYLYLVDDLGFLLTTIPFLFVTLSLFSFKHIIQNIIISIVFTFAVYYLFYKVFQVILPTFSL